jgi:hypothetical protein
LTDLPVFTAVFRGINRFLNYVFRRVGARRSCEGRDADGRGGDAAEQAQEGVHGLQDGDGEEGDDALFEPILQLSYLQLQSQRCSRQERFYIRAKYFFSKNALCY